MRLSLIVAPLTAWFRANARALPWRGTRDPYKIWVSEILLQQTRIETVRERYRALLAELPDVFALAACPEDRLLKLWEGLGYYSRARNLGNAARRIVECHGGEFPADFDALRQLPGIGDYTAGAIGAMAFELATPAVDGNVLRVLSRFENSDDDVMNPAVRRRFTAALRAVYPPSGDRGAFTQALMELGELVCVPGAAVRCADCPIAEFCRARAAGTAAALPVRRVRTARPAETRTVLALRCGNRVAVRRRPATGLLAGLWEIPNFAGTADENALREKFPALRQPTRGPDTRHRFTHLEWRLEWWSARCDSERPDFQWVEIDRLRWELSLPSAFKPFFRLKFPENVV